MAYNLHLAVKRRLPRSHLILLLIVVLSLAFMLFGNERSAPPDPESAGLRRMPASQAANQPTFVAPQSPADEAPQPQNEPAKPLLRPAEKDPQHPETPKAVRESRTAVRAGRDEPGVPGKAGEPQLNQTEDRKAKKKASVNREPSEISDKTKTLQHGQVENVDSVAIRPEHQIKTTNKQDVKPEAGPIKTTSPEASPTQTHEEMMAQRMRARSKRIQRTCALYPKYKLGFLSQELFFDADRALVWCPVFKAGSSNWLDLFCKVHGIPSSPPDNVCGIHLLRKHLGQMRTTVQPAQLQKAAKHAFLIVRHPLERLLSAFRDKLECPCPASDPDCIRCIPNGFYAKKRKRMIGLHRKRSVDNPKPGWPEVEPLPVDPSEIRVVGTRPETPPPPPLADPEPLTFAEFMRSVAAASVQDEHWKPYFIHCTMCDVQYDLVGQFETLVEDQLYIAQRTGLTEALGGSVATLHKTNQNKAGSSGARDTLRRYYSQITEKELLAVIRLFKIDFEMFGYSYEEYFSYVKPEEEENAANTVQ